MGFALSIDKDVEIKIDASIKITTPKPPGKVILTSIVGGIHITSGAQDMAYTLRNDQQIGLQIAYVDADGNPATVDGNVAWQSSDENVARIEPGALDGMTVTLVAENNGTCQIRATADADLGDGTRELITLLDVEVVSGEAVAGTISPVGEPTDKP